VPIVGEMSLPPMFVTRKFPPSVGGMETLASGVWEVLRESDDNAILVSHRGSNSTLLLWLPVAAWKVAWSLLRRQVGFVLVGDAATYAFLHPILRLLGADYGTMVMGLDLTYGNRVYRYVVYRALQRAPLVLAISEATARTTEEIGVPKERIRVVRPGIPVPRVNADTRSRARATLISALGILNDSVLVLSLGRLVRRKGFRWFVEHVLPATASEVHYLVAGGGPEAGAIIEAARAAGVSDRVHLLGQVGDHLRDQLFFGCDLMVQPNIRVPNDVEGFGLVIIESTLRGTPVVAASLQGIKDAVVDRVTGLLVPTESSSDWCELIVKLTSDPSELEVLGATFRENAIDLYGQERMARELLSVIDNSQT